jgi:hypothetical protein
METRKKTPIESIPQKFLDQLIEAAAYIAASDLIIYVETINNQNSQK